MRWRFDPRADVFGRGEQALAEIRLPDAVDDHTRRRRAAAIYDPLREREPVAARAFGQWVQPRRHTGLHGFGLLLPVAAFEHARHARLCALRERERMTGINPVGPVVGNL